MIAQRAIYEGRVQGVGFRYTVKQIAMGYDVIGNIRNLADGTVELNLMGEIDEVKEFLDEISDESTLAHHIKDAHVMQIPLLENIKGFTITA